jgi:hypothetical protein
VLVSNVEYELELGTSLCGFVLGTQKITSSWNEILASELHVLTRCKTLLAMAHFIICR